MAKYVNVHLEVNKLIKVDSNDNYFEEALEIFNDYEISSEYLNDRNIFINENTDVIKIANKLSDELYEKYNVYLTHDIIKEQIENVFEDNDFSNYILEETINLLETKYNLSFNTINI